MDGLVQSLVMRNAKVFFAENCERLFQEWTLLLQRTALPAGITSEDKRVSDAFAILNAQIADGGTFSRLAYLRLTQTLAALEKIIEADREHGRIPPQKGRGNASVAIDIYLRARGIPSAGRRWRERINKRLRIGRRWANLGGSLPLLLVTYSPQAERIIRNFSVKPPVLRALADKMPLIYPPELVAAAKALAEVAQSVIVSEALCSTSQIQGTLKQVKIALQS